MQWITEEFTDLIENSPLPLKSEGETYARMNRGIAKAYLARILLQSASPQFNGNPKYNNIRNATELRYSRQRMTRINGNWLARLL